LRSCSQGLVATTERSANRRELLRDRGRELARASLDLILPDSGQVPRRGQDREVVLGLLEDRGKDPSFAAQLPFDPSRDAFASERDGGGARPLAPFDSVEVAPWIEWRREAKLAAPWIRRRTSQVPSLSAPIQARLMSSRLLMSMEENCSHGKLTGHRSSHASGSARRRAGRMIRNRMMNRIDPHPAVADR
jgi:hypothetical protein